MTKQQTTILQLDSVQDYPGQLLPEGNTNLDFIEAGDSDLQWHQLGHMQICT